MALWAVGGLVCCHKSHSCVQSLLPLQYSFAFSLLLSLTLLQHSSALSVLSTCRLGGAFMHERDFFMPQWKKLNRWSIISDELFWLLWWLIYWDPWKHKNVKMLDYNSKPHSISRTKIWESLNYIYRIIINAACALYHSEVPCDYMQLTSQ